MHFKTYLLGAALVSSGCENPLDDAEWMDDLSKESSIVGPYAPGLFSAACNPAFLGQIAQPLSTFNAKVLDQITLMDAPIEVSAHVGEVTEGVVFYDGGDGEIQGSVQSNALYFSSEAWDIGCVGAYLYNPRSDSDPTLDLDGGDLTVYSQTDEAYENIRVLWTSSKGWEVPAQISFMIDDEWDSSSNAHSIPDLHAALADLTQFVQASTTPVLCPNADAFYEDCD